MFANTTRFRLFLASALLLAMGFALAAPDRVAAQPDRPVTTDGAENHGEKYPADAEVYVAQLTPLNAHITQRAATGRVVFIIEGDSLTIRIDAKGLYPGIMHLQHAHGFIDGGEAVCPTRRADDNGDKIVDLLETRPFTGITLIPFNAHPVDLEITELTYPVAHGKKGVIHYEETVSLSELKDAVWAKYGIELDLEQRTVFLHGVPDTAYLPDSVQSLPGVPAHITLPVACGEIRQVR